MKNLLPRSAQLALSPFRFVKHCWSDCPKHLRCSTLALSALVNLLLASMLLNGCASTKAGKAAEQQLYNTATNIVAKVQAVAPFPAGLQQ